MIQACYFINTDQKPIASRVVGYKVIQPMTLQFQVITLIEEIYHHPEASDSATILIIREYHGQIIRPQHHNKYPAVYMLYMAQENYLNSGTIKEI